MRGGGGFRLISAINCRMQAHTALCPVTVVWGAVEKKLAPRLPFPEQAIAGPQAAPARHSIGLANRADGEQLRKIAARDAGLRSGRARVHRAATLNSAAPNNIDRQPLLHRWDRVREVLGCAQCYPRNRHVCVWRHSRIWGCSCRGAREQQLRGMMHRLIRE